MPPENTDWFDDGCNVKKRFVCKVRASRCAQFSLEHVFYTAFCKCATLLPRLQSSPPIFAVVLIQDLAFDTLFVHFPQFTATNYILATYTRLHLRTCNPSPTHTILQTHWLLP